MAPHRSAAVALLLVAASVSLAACSPAGNPVATFRVIDEEYRIELATPELVAHAEALLAGEPVASIPLGRVVRGETSVNTGWSWHIDPATLEFAEMTIEVCDGLPSYVEQEIVTSPDYCPWSAELVAIDR